MVYDPSFFGSTFGLIFMAFVLVLLILWTLLPFAIFGIKGKLDEMISLNRDIHDELKKLNTDVSSISEDHVEPVVELPVEPMPSPSVQICPNCGQKNSQRMTNCTKCGNELKQEPVI